MSASDKFIKTARTLLPSPFAIAILLTFLTFILALVLTEPKEGSKQVIQLLEFWETGLWHEGIIVFAFQMMVMLGLGHALALTKPVDFLIKKTLKYCTNTASAAAAVTFFTIVMSLFNWGLGLIFGAIFARKVAEYAQEKGFKINYPLIGACGYSGLMVWHGGLSGSSLIKISESGHLKKMMKDIFADFPQKLDALPDQITYQDTVFSSMNITVSVVLLIVLPLTMYWVGKRLKPEELFLKKKQEVPEEKEELIGAEKLDVKPYVAILIVGMILFMAVYKAFIQPKELSLKFINPNYINLVLLGLGIALHGNFNRFLKAVNEAIPGAAGILIQFPLYFGIMGIMTNSGLVGEFAAFFEQISNEVTYPLFTFVSAGVVNVFVPSGGGQWAVQGPIIIQASQALGIELPKSIMAMAYGDQLTNMLQPFWALPLLGITGLKAQHILPYTLLLMLIGTVIFTSALIIF